MKMHPIKSSAISEIGYNERAQELHVRFVHGTMTYVYVHVPLFLVGAIFKSASKGKAMHRHIIDKAEFRKEEIRDA